MIKTITWFFYAGLLVLLSGYPTGPFRTLELLYQDIGEFYEDQNRRATDFDVPKFWMIWSGSSRGAIVTLAPIFLFGLLLCKNYFTTGKLISWVDDKRNLINAGTCKAIDWSFSLYTSLCWAQVTSKTTRNKQLRSTQVTEKTARNRAFREVWTETTQNFKPSSIDSQLWGRKFRQLLIFDTVFKSIRFGQKQHIKKNNLFNKLLGDLNVRHVRVRTTDATKIPFKQDLIKKSKWVRNVEWWQKQYERKQSSRDIFLPILFITSRGN